MNIVHTKGDCFALQKKSDFQKASAAYLFH